MNKVQVAQFLKPSIVAIGLSEQLSNGTVRLNIVGSGFNVRRSGLVVTCSHVLSAISPTAVEQLLNSTESADGEIVRIEAVVPHVYFFWMRDDGKWAIAQKEVAQAQGDPKEDIALLGFHPGHFISGHREEYPFLELDASTQPEGTEIGIVGFPLGDILHQALGSATHSFSFGHIGGVLPFYSEKKQPARYQFDLASNGGNSGGPAFDVESGKAIGMLQGAMAPTTSVPDIRLTTGIAYGAPAWKIAEAINAWDQALEIRTKLTASASVSE